MDVRFEFVDDYNSIFTRLEVPIYIEDWIKSIIVRLYRYLRCHLFSTLSLKRFNTRSTVLSLYVDVRFEFVDDYSSIFTRLEISRIGLKVPL